MRRAGAIAVAGVAVVAAVAAAAWHRADVEGRTVSIVRSGSADRPLSSSSPSVAGRAATRDVIRTPIANFRNPWAMVFLPDGRLLVTQKREGLRIVTTGGMVSAPLAGLPPVAEGGQGGLLDVALDPAFADNRRIWLTFSEPRDDGAAALAALRGTLRRDADGRERVADATIIWRQRPAIAGVQHFGGRLAFAPDGALFVTSGDRHEGAPAQSRRTTLGKIIRIDPATLAAEIWTSGHRNPYGLVFSSTGRLYESEMGPQGGDEFNIIRPRRNYGWPEVSEGDYGRSEPIPRHATDPRFTAPLVARTPVIAPGGMIEYRGDRFRGWRGDFLLAGLVAQGIVRVRVSGPRAAEVARIPLGARIREIEEAPDGSLWVLEDGRDGRLVRLDPAD